ncbi:MAG: hypothetical protein AAF799_13510 [Myxococcota bacterium]
MSAEAIVVGLLGLWVVAAALVQVPWGSRWVPNVVMTLFLPVWTLFTDPMIAFDYGLYWQSRGKGADEDEWEPVEIAAPRGLLSALWNPRKRMAARFRALVALVTALRMQRRTDAIPDSVAYRILEEHVRSQRSNRDPFVFAIVMTDPRDDEAEPHFLYVSERCES